jgi:hypothetical protein
VAVPARNVAHLTPLKHLKFIDGVFHDPAQGMADVEVAIGVGRAVVQNKRLAWVLLRSLFVNLVLSPKCLKLWLSLHGIGPHIELCLGQVNGIFVASGFCHNFLSLVGLDHN